MAAGDREVLKALEEVTTRNVKTVIAHANVTREMVVELEKKVKSLDDLVRRYDEKIDLLQKQVVVLQTKLFSGGS